MKIHYLQHVPFEGLGNIEDWARQNNHQLSSTKVYESQNFPSLNQFDMLIIVGGPMGIFDYRQHSWLMAEKHFLKSVVKSNKKVLGICLGAQLIADALDAPVFPNIDKEIGWHPVFRNPQISDLRWKNVLPEQMDVLHWHGDTFELPKNAIHFYKSEACRNQAFLVENRILGLQFHPELKRENLEQLIENCASDLTKGKFIQSAKRMMVNDRKFEETNQIMFKILDTFTGKNVQVNLQPQANINNQQRK